MRKAIVPITLAVLTAAALVFSGCSLTGQRGAVTEKKDFTNFTQVDVQDIFEVEITQSDLFSITITTDADLHDYIAISKEGETLRIYINPHHTFTDFTRKAKTLKAKITMPAIYRLQLSGATKGTITGFKSSHDFSINVSGASSLGIDNMEIGNVEFGISGASKVTGSMKAGDAKFEVSGASQVELTGSANNTTLNVSGASNLNLASFTLNNATVNLSGASEATVNAKGRLDPVLSDASRLYFLGNPTIDNAKVSGASTIKHE